MVRRAYVDRREAARRQRVHRARSHGMAPEEHRHGTGGAQSPGRRLLVRRAPRVVRRHPRSRRRGHHRAHRRGREGISLSGHLPPLARPQFQYFRRLRAAAGAGAPGRYAADGHRQGLSRLAIDEHHAERHGRPGQFGWPAGVSVGLEEGLEVNLLGLNFGVDPKSLSIKLPIVGRLGPKNQPEPTNIPAAGL